MTKQNFTSISVILDRSGSMNSIKESTIAGYNEFIKKQKENNVGECFVSLHQFDNEYQTDYIFKPINEVEELNTTNFVPRGTTALLDSIGKTINELGQKLSSMEEDERPDTVIVVILTDGMENASKEFDQEKIKTLITEQTEKYDWDFVFLGANQDAITVANNFNIKGGNAMTYAYTDKGTRSAFTSLSQGLCRRVNSKADAYLRGASSNEATKQFKSLDTFTDQDRKNQNI